MTSPLFFPISALGAVMVTLVRELFGYDDKFDLFVTDAAFNALNIILSALISDMIADNPFGTFALRNAYLMAALVVCQAIVAVLASFVKKDVRFAIDGGGKAIVAALFFG